jgi:ABC-type glycerol-3-phosphate transport system permease component
MSQSTLTTHNQVAASIKSNRHYVLTRLLQATGGYAVLVFAVLLSLYPMAVMVLNSFKSDAEISRNPAGLPIDWTLASYGAIFEYHGGMWINFMNSVFIATTSTVISLFLVSLAAFAFAKYNFRGRNLIFAMLLATMMVPGEITIPPLYLMFARMNWLNTYQVQIVPTLTSIFGLFLVRQYMLEIPDALIDAARIDGAGHWQIYRHIMIPTSMPILGAFAILHFQGVWNAYLWPLVVATSRAVQPIMVVLPNLRDPHIGYLPVWGTIMAGAVLSTLPIVVVFIAFQDKFMSSVTIGAVKE